MEKEEAEAPQQGLLCLTQVVKRKYKGIFRE